MQSLTKYGIARPDIIGTFSSFLCAVHCLVTPLLFVIQVGHTSHAAIKWWSSIDYIFMMISLLVVFQSARNSTYAQMPLLLYISWVLLVCGVIGHNTSDIHVFEFIKWFGAIALIVLHLFNLMTCRCKGDSCCFPNH